MFKSFFPRPALFFSSAAVWSLVAIFAWFGFAAHLPGMWPTFETAMKQPLPTTATFYRRESDLVLSLLLDHGSHFCPGLAAD